MGDVVDFLLGEHISDHESVSLLGCVDVEEFGEIRADYLEEVISSILLVHVDHLSPKSPSHQWHAMLPFTYD